MSVLFAATVVVPVPLSEEIVSLFATLNVPPRLTETKLVAGKACDVYEPPQVCEQGYVVLYLHGGGYISGSAAVYRDFTATLSNATGCVVLAVSTSKSVAMPSGL